MLDVRCNAAIGSLHMDTAFTATHPWTVLFGPSGSGKSSLLRLIAGLWRPENSRVLLASDDVGKLQPHLRRVALVAQQPALFPHMDARRNVTFAMATRPATAVHNVAKLYEQADKLLQRLHVAHVAAQMPRELSGGEIKRVAIARALATNPRLLLLDEVFTGMSASLAADLRLEIRAWQKQTGVPILSVTHDVAEALETDEVIRIDAGRIVAQGPPHVVLSDERKAMMLALSSQPRL